MMFRIGQKVVCVDDHLSGRYLPAGILIRHDATMNGLRTGSIYTIRELVEAWGTPCCRLEEIDRGFDAALHQEGCFAQPRFRPLTESKSKTSFMTGADPSTDQFDNRCKIRKKVAQ